MKRVFKIFLMVCCVWLQSSCLELLFQSGNLLGGNLGTATDAGDGNEPDLITLDGNDSSLMEEGPLPLPVTMSKLDGVDATKLIITSEPYELAKNSGWMRTALADSDNCVAGAACLVSVRGLAGAVQDPNTTPFVFLYADDDNNVFTSANADGSFDSVDLVLTLDETQEKTDVVLIVGMTEDNVTDGVATYPTYFAVTDSGSVEYTQTNTNGTVATGIMFVDDFDNTYYVVTDADDLSDIWRQDASGSIPLLILEDSSLDVIDIIAIGTDQVIVFFEDGSTQLVEIEDGQAKVTPMASLLRRALAQEAGGRESTDGKFIKDPVEIFDFSDYDFAAAKFFPYQDIGFIVSIEPIPDPGVTTGMLAAYVSLDGEDIRTLVPFDPENPDAPKKAYLAFTDDYFYVLAQFDNLGEVRTEFSRMPISDDLDTTFTNAWGNREVLFPEMNQEPIDLDARAGVFVFSALNVMHDRELILWNEGDSELTQIWNFGIQSGVDPLLPGLAGGVEIAPNGKFLLACAFVGAAPEGVEQSEEVRALVSHGAHIYVHRIGVDDPGEFHLIIDHVAVGSCPDGMQITDDYRLRYFSYATDDVPSQMTFIDLHTVEELKDYLE